MDRAAETLVRDLMAPRPFTLTAGQSLTLAESAMQSMNIRHIPVVAAGDRLVGLVTHRDVLAAKLSILETLSETDRDRYELKIPVSRIMQKTVWSVAPDTTALHAARLLKEHSFGCLPVVQGGTLVGLVTEVDFLRLVMDSPNLKKPLEPVTAASVMAPPPRALRTNDTIGAARRAMQTAGVRQVAIVDQRGRPVGVATQRDLDTAVAILGDASKADGLALGFLDKQPPYVVAFDAPLGPVLLDMSVRHVGWALVVEDDQLVGVLGAADAWRWLEEGLRDRG